LSLDPEAINDGLRVAHRFLPSSCAHRRMNTAWMARMLFIEAMVRHEALCIRVEVGDLHRLAVAAAG